MCIKANLFILDFEFEVASEIGFAQESNHVTKGVDAKVSIPVLRSFSNRGRVEVGWATREHSAVAGRDFVDSSGIVVFEDGQNEAVLNVFLLEPPTKGNSELSFIVELGHVDGEATVGRYETIVYIKNPPLETGEGGSPQH